VALLRSTIPEGSMLDLALAPADVSSPVDGPIPGSIPVMAGPRVVIRGPDALGRLLFPPTPDAFADGYLRGDLDVEGDLLAAVRAASAMDLRTLRVADWRRLIRWGIELRRNAGPPAPLTRVARMNGRRHSRARDMAAIRFHYDVGEAFFRLWLDDRMTYSCAYFPPGSTAASAAQTLDAAQEAKLELIARKLRAAPGSRLLDIGCGWGSLVRYTAERHGVSAVGVTLSQRQADQANASAMAAGLADHVTVQVRDYRDLGPLGEFDIVASVGMFEHVGRGNLAVYFRAASAALRPGGLFLNHGIAIARMPRRRASRHDASTGRFIDRYVFPDGELVSVEEAVRVARATGFEVIDVQSLRQHYALTLAAWVSRLESHWDEAVAAAGDEVCRTWRLYMSAARGGFEHGDLDVCQLLLAKRRQDGSPADVPLRPWW
jgi:cyclopropane-fatty-acyl-phospholipid synthase